jgi:CheY-like chemotaxis protein
VAQLRADPTPADRQRLTLRVESAVASINGLFDTLLDISKLDAGVVTAQMSDFPIRQVLDRVEATFAADAQSRGLTLRVRQHGGWVRSDPVLLQRIIDNLVANALRYTRRGGVLVGCRPSDEGLRVDVWDTGIGIAPDKHQVIFSEFYQVSPAGTLRGEGLGLGLSIVARLCQLLGHGIDVASRPGRGSRFTVALPAAPAQTMPVPSPNADFVPEDPLRGLRVLVIDNDPDVLESTAGLLRVWDCVVVVAASGEQAQERLGGEAPDLAIADVHLDHDEDGPALVAQLRLQFGIDFPAIVVSGDVSQATRDRVAACDLPLLEKPVAPLRLRTLATRLVRAASRREAAASPGA